MLRKENDLPEVTQQVWVEPSLQSQHILSPRADFFPLHQLFILLSCQLETSAPMEWSGWHLSSGHSTIILDTRFVSQQIIDSSVPGVGAEVAAALEAMLAPSLLWKPQTNQKYFSGRKISPVLCRTSPLNLQPSSLQTQSTLPIVTCWSKIIAITYQAFCLALGQASAIIYLISVSQLKQGKSKNSDLRLSRPRKNKPGTFSC